MSHTLSLPSWRNVFARSEDVSICRIDSRVYNPVRTSASGKRDEAAPAKPLKVSVRGDEGSHY
jgi:hypothetical protein